MRNILAYLIILMICGLAISLTLTVGQTLQIAGSIPTASEAKPSQAADIRDTFNENLQVGVILSMFLVGTDIDIQHLVRKGHNAVFVSHASIIIPFLFGTTLSVFIYRSMAPASVPFKAFALFMGVAMSITAFPVLARIVQDRGLTHSTLGVLSLGCAAIDDVTAWCILAVVLAIVKADDIGGSLVIILLVVIYACIMIFLVKPVFSRIVPSGGSGTQASNAYYNSWLAVALIFALTAGLVTEVIGAFTDCSERFWREWFSLWATFEIFASNASKTSHQFCYYLCFSPSQACGPKSVF